MPRKARFDSMPTPVGRRVAITALAPAEPIAAEPAAGAPPSSDGSPFVGPYRRGSKWYHNDKGIEWEVAPPGVSVVDWLDRLGRMITHDHVAYILSRGNERKMLEDGSFSKFPMGKTVVYEPTEVAAVLRGLRVASRRQTAAFIAGLENWRNRRDWWSDAALARRLRVPVAIIRERAPENRSPVSIAIWLERCDEES
jgi:hypothetical protein